MSYDSGVVLPVRVDLQTTMESGQPPHFIWNRVPGDVVAFQRRLGDKLWTLAQLPGGLVRTDSRDVARTLQLLRAKDNPTMIKGKIATDPVMREAVARFPMLRLTKSDPWETTVCFICSVNNNIPRIRGMVQKLIGPDGFVLPPGKLCKKDLRSMGFGYRSEYLNETARLVSEGEFDLDEVNDMDYPNAKQALQQLPGVGPKVADCILLYGFGNLSAFPQDVWIKKAMREGYGLKKPKEVEEFVSTRWGSHAGYAQHYLFWHYRSK
jgi:N-glycosylase/DNA lyase